MVLELNALFVGNYLTAFPISVLDTVSLPDAVGFMARISWIAGGEDKIILLSWFGQQREGEEGGEAEGAVHAFGAEVV